jgi:hypothetical protein
VEERRRPIRSGSTSGGFAPRRIGVSGPGGRDGAPDGAADRTTPRARRKPWWEVMHPEGAEGSFRDLPRLVTDSVRLAWQAGRKELLVTASLQLLVALGIAAQLFIGKALLDAVLRAGGENRFVEVLPTLAALVAVTVVLDFAQAVENEQSRVLGELVGRRAFDRVLDVATRVDLLSFEDPDFYDRLARARAQGMFRSL